jgi:hypothetical protein
MVSIASIRDKNQETVRDIIPAEDTELLALFRKYQAQASLSTYDVASGKHVSFPSSVNGHESVVYRRRMWSWL